MSNRSLIIDTSSLIPEIQKPNPTPVCTSAHTPHSKGKGSKSKGSKTKSSKSKGSKSENLHLKSDKQPKEPKSHNHSSYSKKSGKKAAE